MTVDVMQALVQYGLECGEVELQERPVPVPGRGTAVLRVAAVGVCGSDVHQYRGNPSWRVQPPVTLGHEFGGTGVFVGEGVSARKEGDRVVSETAARICGRCLYCRSGQYNVCPHREGFGTVIDGAMAEYIVVPARCLHPIPASLPFEVAALTEPVCVAYNAIVERSSLKPGESVLILGPGPIGLLSLAMARLRGAGAVVVAGLGADARRLALARLMGATHTVDLERDDLPSVLSEIGDGLGPDLVVDAAGVSASFRTAMDVVRPLGRITKVGWGPGPLMASLDPLVAKAVTVSGSFSHTYSTWERVIELLAGERIDVRPLIGLEAGLTRWREGFDGMHDGRFPKAVLRP